MQTQPYFTMPKLSNVPETDNSKPFIDNHIITAKTHKQGNKIIAFEATIKGKKKRFNINPKKWDILEQFKQLEKFIKS